MSSTTRTQVPVNSGCSDAAICQAAAAPSTATTAGGKGLADTGAPPTARACWRSAPRWSSVAV